MLRVLLFSLILICTAFPQYNMYYYYNQPSSSGSGSTGGGGTAPLDPSTLSPTDWFDENERANNSWGDKLSAAAFGDGGATSYYPFTQNGLTYYESDGGFTPYFTYNTSFMDAPNQSFSFVMAYKTRAAGTATVHRIFYQSSDDPEATWGILRIAGVKAQYYANDDALHSMTVISSDAINDDVWRIVIMTVKQEANNGELFVYQSTGETLTDTEGAWILSNYNGSRDGTFLNGGGGTTATWTGTAEMIFFANKILTKEEANGIGTWLADKWDITWIDN